MKSFHGGVHPNDSKKYTAAKPIETAPLPQRVIIPLRQHIGAPVSAIVKKGDEVKKGQLIAESNAFVSGNVHASISGKVTDIADYPHSGFGTCLSIVIESDGKDEWAEGIPVKRQWEKLDAKELSGIIRGAGIVGMGGATFPTHVKLAPPPDKKIDTFILNGSECEPFLTADYRSMLEYPDRIVSGVLITMKVLGVTTGYVGIEDNKPDAIKALQSAFSGTQVKVVALPTKYPQGAEKMLIFMLTGREVPSGGLPMDVGVVVQNVGTIIAVSDAVTQGIPLIQRVLTVSGSAVKEPKNLLMRIGSTFADALNLCGGLSGELSKIIAGGPMMGFAQSTTELPIIKGTSGILFLTKKDVNDAKESACIHCGRCVEACPMGLNPSMLSILGERGLYAEAKDEYNLMDCMECGSCVYVCPAKRKIVQYVRYCKTQNAIQAQKEQAKVAV
ncbi:MAG: Electron transport complex protein RnfC [Pelotomaculum sp. PtaB.Bin104]|nr:MAG: Electron transport complex protein RnfC [Pelotomaculum sp. PtaB.Bin104]